MNVIVRLAGDTNLIYRNVVKFTFDKSKMYLFGQCGRKVELNRKKVKLSEVVNAPVEDDICWHRYVCIG